MRGHKGENELFLVVLLCCCSVVTNLLLDASNGNGTLRATINSNFRAIQQLNNKLTEAMVENGRLKKGLDAAESTRNASLIRFPGNWILAFRGTAGIGEPMYDTYTRVGYNDDRLLICMTLPPGCTTVNGSLPCDRHYRSRLLDLWPSNAIDLVRVVLYENGEERRRLTFTGTGSDYISWFSQSRLIKSSWPNLRAVTDVNCFFSIIGDERIRRRFFINRPYWGCHNDRGWMVVKDQRSDTCDWATVERVPTILYSPFNFDVTWEEGDFQKADVMAVFVKLRRIPQIINLF